MADPTAEIISTADISSITAPPPSTIPVAPPNPYYTIRALPSKGYGCIALTPIPRGTRILTDTPLLSVPNAHYTAADISTTFNTLNAAQQTLYLSLHSAHAQPPSAWPSSIHPSVSDAERHRITEQHTARTAPTASLLSIFQTNCIERGPGAAVFPHVSRFNHSCVPNACFSWNEAMGREVVHAMRDVKRGEEVCVGYVDVVHGRELRGWELRHYGFICGCVACGDVDDEKGFAYQTAQRRLQIEELERETWMLRGRRLLDGAREPQFAIKLLRLAGLLQQEGLWDARLAGVLFDLALVCEVHGDFKVGLAAGERALLVKRDCQGEDFPEYAKYAEAVERIRAKRRR